MEGSTRLYRVEKKGKSVAFPDIFYLSKNFEIVRAKPQTTQV